MSKYAVNIFQLILANRKIHCFVESTQSRSGPDRISANQARLGEGRAVASQWSVYGLVSMRHNLIRSTSTDYLVDSVRLGTEYSRLGKVTRAGSIFNAARKVASKAVTQVLTSEQQVDFDLRYAQFLASVGNTTRR
jgi:hypothetical protein